MSTALETPPAPPKEEVKPTTPETKPTPPAQPEQTFLERMTGRKLKPEKPPEAPAGDKPPGDKPKPAAKVKKLDPPPAPPAPPAPDYDKIAEAAARGVATAITKKDDETKKKSGHDSEFTAEQQENIEVLERMGKDYPDEAGKAQQYADSIRKTKEYRAKWEDENPGQKWNKDDPQHDDFFDGIEVDWSDVRFNRTLARMEAEAKSDNKEVKDKLAALEAREQRRQQERTVAPTIIKARNDAVREFFKGMGDGFSKVLDARGEQDKAEADRLVAEDNLNVHALKAAENIEILATELTKLSLTDKEGNSLFPYNEKDPIHGYIARFVDEEQAAMKSLSDDEQRDQQGRRFLTIGEYEKLTPDQRRYYWTFTTDDLVRIYVERERKRVQTIVQDFENTAAKRGYTKSKTENPAPSGEVKKPEEAPKPPEKPRSPAGSVEPLSTHPPRAGKLNDDSGVSSFEQRWLRRG